MGCKLHVPLFSLAAYKLLVKVLHGRKRWLSIIFLHILFYKIVSVATK